MIRIARDAICSLFLKIMVVFSVFCIFSLSSFSPFSRDGSFFTSTAEAGMRDQEAEFRWLQYKKYHLYGYVGLSYDYLDSEIERDDAVSKRDRYSFIQEYSINLKSYLYHPKFLIYTLGFDWAIESGSFPVFDYRRYTIALDFLKTRPFSFSVWAGYDDADNYDGTMVGFSASYMRNKKTRSFKNMRDLSEYVRRQRGNNRNYLNQVNNNSNFYQYNFKDNQNNTNQNNNLNQYNNNQNITNQYNNLGTLKKATGPPRNIFDRVLPVAYYYDFSWNNYEDSSGDSEEDYYFSQFRAKGDFGTRRTSTNYWINLAYEKDEDQTDGTTSDETTYYSELRTVTEFANRNVLNTTLRYDVSEYDFDGRGSDSNDFYIAGDYSGSFYKRRWHYSLNGRYRTSDNSVDSEESEFIGRIHSSSRVRRVDLKYLFGARYQNDSEQTDDSYSIFADASADTRLNNNLFFRLSSGVEWGREIEAFRARVSSRYLPSRRLTVWAYYDFTTSSGDYANYNDAAYPENYGIGGNTRHEVGLGANSRIRDIFLESTARYSWFDSSESFQWDNTLSTSLYGRVNLTFGVSLTAEKGTVPLTNRGIISKDTVFGIRLYNVISAYLRRNMAFRLYSSYSRTENSQEYYSYKINPSLSWRIRKLYISAEYRFYVDKNDNAKLTEHRLYLKGRRPFWL